MTQPQEFKEIRSLLRSRLDAHGFDMIALPDGEEEWAIRVEDAETGDAKGAAEESGGERLFVHTAGRAPNGEGVPVTARLQRQGGRITALYQLSAAGHLLESADDPQLRRRLDAARTDRQQEQKRRKRTGVLWWTLAVLACAACVLSAVAQHGGLP
ncbi:MAG: hypothetical protein ACOX41_00905 [Anaerovoracaceae bacterium]|jgi:hypothetical protein